MENSTKKEQETAKKQWVEPEMNNVVIQAAVKGKSSDGSVFAS
jgi:hypothetical protein